MSHMPKTSDGSVIIRDAAHWFRHRCYDYRQFSDLEALGRRKRERNERMSDAAQQRSQEKRECMTEQLRRLTTGPPLGGDGRGTPAAVTASHDRAAKRGGGSSP